MPAAPRYALATISMALPKQTLIAIAQTIPDFRYTGEVKADLFRKISTARATFWDDQDQIAREAKAGASTTTSVTVASPRRRSLCKITASEVNAWLLTLPPVPYHGED